MRRGAGAGERLELRVRLGVLAATGALVTGCASSGYTYVANTDDGAYFKVPGDWHVFDADEVHERRTAEVTPERAERMRTAQWAIAFDADPEPTLDHVFVEPSDHPVGYARVRDLDGQERDQFSLASLRNEFLPLDRISQQDADRVEPLEVEEIGSGEVGGEEGLRGVRLVFNIRAASGAVLTYQQASFVDADTEKVYLIALGCTADCYEDNRRAIEEVARSWTIKEPRS